MELNNQDQNEIWKDIIGYEGIYQISNCGRVKSLDREIHKNNGVIEHRNGQIMMLSLDKDGYCYLGLRRQDKIKKFFRVHQLVAIAFLENPYNFNQINHKDENKSNNCVENLEWCDSQYNNKYGTKLERTQITKIQNNSYNCRKPVLQFELNNVLVKRWESASQAEKVLNFSGACINRCCNHQRNKYRNYKWEFENNKKEDFN